MHILTTLTPISAPGGSAVALGFFDGVHLGHRAVLTAAVDYAAAHGLTAAAFTFLLPPDHPMKGGRIFPEREKHRRVAELGIQPTEENLKVLEDYLIDSPYVAPGPESLTRLHEAMYTMQ